MPRPQNPENKLLLRWVEEYQRMGPAQKRKARALIQILVGDDIREASPYGPTGPEGAVGMFPERPAS